MMEIISEEDERQNKLTIQKLVKDYFSYESASFEKFKSLLWKRDIAPEYDFITKSKDLRIVKEVEVSNENDRSFEIFNTFFGHLGVSFSDYRNNHITEGKNTMKIQKWIFSKLSTNCENFFWFFSRFKVSDVFDKSFCKIIRGDKLYVESGQHKNPLSNIDFENIIKINYSKDGNDKVCFKFRKKETDKIVINLLVDTEKFFDYIDLDVLKEAIRKIYEKIGVSRAPTRKLYFVLSLNFADWFLASTGENWSSCLNLESSYEECFWKGLPALIEDKNRCMVYLTDGKIKNYKGIKTYHIISRSWGLLVRNKPENKIFLSMVRSYPNNFDFETLFREHFKELEIGRVNWDNTSNYEHPYNFDGMFIYVDGETSYVASIYCDSCGLKYNEKENKFYWSVCDRGPSRLFKRGNEIFEDSWYIDYDDGLSGLIDYGKTISHYWC